MVPSVKNQQPDCGWCKERLARSQSGSMMAVMFAMMVIIGLGLGALAVDFSHMLAVRGELQNAVDAAALAGAQDLAQNSDQCESDALAVAAINKADGRAVSNNSANTAITVLVSQAGPSDPGTVEVTAQMRVNHLLASIFGRSSDVVSVTGTAGGTATNKTINGNQAFPLAVSIDAVPRDNNVDGTPLYARGIGQSISFYINSQQVKNAAFTSFTQSSANANYINKAIDQALGLVDPVAGFIPSMNVGDYINLSNGVIGQKRLAQGADLNALLAQPLLILPVISGDPSYSQSRPILGWIGVKLTGVTVDQKGGVVETITGTLIKTMVKGESGPTGTTGNPVYDAAIQELSVGSVKLVNNPTS